MEHFHESIHGWFNFPSVYSKMVEQASDGAKFVEVGSWHGKSSAFMAVEIINSGKDIRFFCVDSWLGDGIFRDINSHVAKFYDHNDPSTGLFDIFMRNTLPVCQAITPMRLDSGMAAGRFADCSLDMVFIDACHYYEEVRKDLENWYPKVKLGGIFAGHDYWPPHWPGVKQAVDDVLREQVHVEEECWLVVKEPFGLLQYSPATPAQC